MNIIPKIEEIIGDYPEFSGIHPIANAFPMKPHHHGQSLDSGRNFQVARIPLFRSPALELFDSLLTYL